MKHSFYLLASLCTFYLVPSSFAYSDETNELLDLSLEELLNVKVSVASTKSENVIETPAIVSRYNRVDLEKMGISTLKEMFNFIPGVIVNDNLMGWSSAQIRGIDEIFNQKVLFLLDGVPYHQPSHSMIPMEGIPWESISHVEVIRGPGTVLYGSQASGGVFNVVTKKGKADSSAYVKLGSNELYEGSGYYNKVLSEDSSLYIAAEYRNEDGYNTTYHEYFPDIGLISDDVHRYIDKQSGLIRYQKSDFSLQLHAFSDATVGINDVYTDENTLQPMTLKSKGWLAHVENSWQINNTEITLFSDYNHYTFDLEVENLLGVGVHGVATKEGDGSKDYRLRYGGNITYPISESMEIYAGIEQEKRSSDNYGVYFLADKSSPLITLFETVEVDELSAYAQLDFHMQKWRFLLGARYTDNEISGQKNHPKSSDDLSI